MTTILSTRRELPASTSLTKLLEAKRIGATITMVALLKSRKMPALMTWITPIRIQLLKSSSLSRSGSQTVLVVPITEEKTRCFTQKITRLIKKSISWMASKRAPRLIWTSWTRKSVDCKTEFRNSPLKRMKTQTRDPEVPIKSSQCWIRPGSPTLAFWVTRLRMRG